jgi:hypothetical protein
VLVLCAFWSTHQAVYVACFGFPTSKGVDVFSKMVESVFWLDIFLNFFMQYNDESQDYKPQKLIRKIIFRYLVSEFIYDFVATIPLRYMNVSSDEDTLKLLQLLRLLRLRKLL